MSQISVLCGIKLHVQTSLVEKGYENLTQPNKSNHNSSSYMIINARIETTVMSFNWRMLRIAWMSKKAENRMKMPSKLRPVV